MGSRKQDSAASAPVAVSPWPKLAGLNVDGAASTRSAEQLLQLRRLVPKFASFFLIRMNKQDN